MQVFDLILIKQQKQQGVWNSYLKYAVKYANCHSEIRLN